MLNVVFGRFVEGRGVFGLLVLRLVFGLALMLHGLPKMATPFSWMNAMAGDAAPPAVLQALAAFAEFGGGLAFIVGLLVPLAAFGVVCEMLTAIVTVHLAAGQPFVATAPGAPSYESAAGYLAVALLMMITGPGALSLDYLLFGRRQQQSANHELSDAPAIEPVRA